jgi:ankyrin repeat domain-containing protein 2
MGNVLFFKGRLFKAAKNGDVVAAKELMEKYGVGADHMASTESSTMSDRTALHKASRAGHIDFVRMLVEECKVKVDPKDVSGQTPLHDACINRHLEIVQCLSGAGANLAAKDNRGITPLHFACRSHQVEIVEFLCTANPEVVNQIDQFKQTPLHWAYEFYNKDIITTLIIHGADIDAKDFAGRKPLDLCTQQ